MSAGAAHSREHLHLPPCPKCMSLKLHPGATSDHPACGGMHGSWSPAPCVVCPEPQAARAPYAHLFPPGCSMLQFMRHADTRAVAICILACLRIYHRPPSDWRPQPGYNPAALVLGQKVQSFHPFTHHALVLAPAPCVHVLQLRLDKLGDDPAHRLSLCKVEHAQGAGSRTAVMPWYWLQRPKCVSSSCTLAHTMMASVSTNSCCRRASAAS